MIRISISKKIIDKYTLDQCIGHGGFGFAFTATNKENGNKVVIKKIDFSQYQGRVRELCKQEGILLSSLNHENIVKCHEYFIEDDSEYIVMEFIEGGDLEKRIEKQKQNGEKFDEFLIIKWILEICDALKYCNEKNIIHRDIKPNNIFIDKNNSAKLADFGISKVLESKTQEAVTGIGTKEYLAPEVLERKSYSFSCVSGVWELFYSSYVS